MQSLEHVFECEGFLPPDHSRPRRLQCRVVDGHDDLTIRPLPSSDHAIDPAIFLYDCRLSSLHGHRHDSTKEDKEVVFACMFKMAVTWRQQFRSELRVCHVTLSSKDGLRGHCMAIGADDGGDGDGGPRHEIALPVKLRLPLAGARYSRQPALRAMTPLIPGDYRLQGFTVTQHGRVYECSVELTLEDDGVLRGTSRELPALLSCPLVGKWSASELSWTMEYRIGQSVSQYHNELTPLAGGLRGKWRHADAMRSSSDRGHIELLVTHAWRRWSRRVHHLYPAAFQEIATLLMLSASSSSPNAPLPSTLWRLVLSFCDFHHFQDAKPSTPCENMLI